VEASMDLAKHIIKFRNSKVLLKNALGTKEVKKLLREHKCNVLELDSGDEELKDIKF
jgi:hypothetical protein